MRTNPWLAAQARLLHIRLLLANMLVRCDRDRRTPSRDELDSLAYAVEKLQRNLLKLATHSCP